MGTEEDAPECACHGFGHEACHVDGSWTLREPATHALLLTDFGFFTEFHSSSWPRHEIPAALLEMESIFILVDSRSKPWDMGEQWRSTSSIEHQEAKGSALPVLHSRLKECETRLVRRWHDQHFPSWFGPWLNALVIWEKQYTKNKSDWWILRWAEREELT
jgi:hypothetical protein